MRRSPLLKTSSRYSAHLAQEPVIGVLFCLLVALTNSVVSAQSNRSGDSASPFVSEPYLVFVAEESAYLRCGPSGDDYRTDPLRHGQELEVYVETEDGWLGVRPTDDSFCWIPADAAKLIDSDLGPNAKPDALEAEIIEDKTVAWIGTNLGRARRYRWLVQLREGETVTILGRSERDGPDGPQTWYRIVPPSGEFRWIHRDQVVTTAEELVADLRSITTDKPIEFLPGGPSHIPEQRARVASSSGSESVGRSESVGSGLRRVSDDQPYRDDLPRETRQERLEALAEIRRLDEIERHIEQRSRSRFDQVDDNHPSEHDSRIASHSEAHENGDGAQHEVRSFSQRVTEGIASLLSGRPKGPANLEPSTESSRRVPDLVPIGSGLAQKSLAPNAASPVVEPAEQPTQLASDAANAASSTQNTPPETLDVASTPSTGEKNAAAEPVQSSTVAATSTTETRTGQSQIAIMSSPRLVARSEYPSSPLRSFVPPRKQRTITSTQLEEVERSVAHATPDSLPSIMSSLMARGASAPEIRLVADAATRLSMHDLAQRARDYESLARRRDGDTIVATTHLGTPSVVMTPPSYPNRTLQTPTIPRPPTPAPAHTGGNFVARVGSPGMTNQTYTNQTMPPVTGPVAPVSHVQSISNSPQPPVSSQSTPANDNASASSDPSGVLVEVYSADPNRPPYAITDQGGQTIAYVTPAPGVELRQHLGSRVRVQGESGFLQGLDTPHVLATAAQRVLR